MIIGALFPSVSLRLGLYMSLLLTVINDFASGSSNSLKYKKTLIISDTPAPSDVHVDFKLPPPRHSANQINSYGGGDSDYGDPDNDYGGGDGYDGPEPNQNAAGPSVAPKGGPDGDYPVAQSAGGGSKVAGVWNGMFVKWNVLIIIILLLF